MFILMKFGPYLCIGILFAILFILWAFWGGDNSQFMGFTPLSPDKLNSYTGSFWGNITPATHDPPSFGVGLLHSSDPEGNNNTSLLHQMEDIPYDISCAQQMEEVLDNYNPAINLNDNHADVIPFQNTKISVGENNIIDNIPFLPAQFQEITNKTVMVTPGPAGVCSCDQQNINDTICINNLSSKPQAQPARRVSNKFISRGEQLCCKTMEGIYGVPFTSTRPHWLINPETGYRLELDCYNEDLQLAVEYNGIQHYKYPNFTNQTEHQFINQRRRDELKVKLCDRNGVYLITVPYNVPYNKIPSFILSHLPENVQQRINDEKTLAHLSSE